MTKRYFSLTGTVDKPLYVITKIAVDVPDGATEDEINKLVIAAANQTYWMPDEDQGYGVNGDDGVELLDTVEIEEDEFVSCSRFGWDE